MEVILKEDVKNLGSKHDLVKVRPGYARNFLFPQGFAVEATEGRIKEVAEITKQRSHKEEKYFKLNFCHYFSLFNYILFYTKIFNNKSMAFRCIL